MPRTPFPPETLDAIASRFKVLAEPARLQVLNQLRSGPLNVTELMDATGLNQANLSKHLQLLHAHGFVARSRDGLFVRYALADRTVFSLCDIMCAQLERRSTDLRRSSRRGTRRP
jgi:DNA-binding transcriptional ArsR family regulator